MEFREGKLNNGLLVKVPINKAIPYKTKLSNDHLLKDMLKASQSVDYNKIDERLKYTWEEVFFIVNMERLNHMALCNNKDLKKYLI